MESSKSRTVLTLLSFFFGALGVDRFYAGNVMLGIIKFLTFGGWGIWALVDFILAVAGKMKDGSGAVISKW
ncbi:TM2 domain-containing protein [Mycoplasma sp. Pen4]|uniref:TM2 domain-containing protein n=1 Tax=Mycoplasma sp. Pen4 TaxID=640330 RepID=UPI0016547E58|nr:TM2 domain-containing protein [Mycoplasma sp. Pen4]QNM93844.1 TM2 domain-containing protein [Mycoplasma sp. Pen4]